MKIVDGGAVNNGPASIGRESGATGVVAVDGGSSAWTNTSSLYIGDSGKGTLSITGGGVVSATSVSVNSASLLAIDVGRSTLLTVSSGNGTITNNGTVRMLAGAGATATSVYSPIAAMFWSGITGTYQAVGGTWDATSHEFTVSTVQSGTSGAPVSIDLANVQRVLIDDSTTAWSVGASFLARTTSTPLDFTATVLSSEVLTNLEDSLDDDQAVRGAWQFATSGGYTGDDPAYLSFGLVPGDSRKRLTVWYDDGAGWAEYAASDLTCDGTYASFTTTRFCSYAVTITLIPGDVNGDNHIDQTDAAVLAAHWGTSVSGGPQEGDFNRDGSVNAADASILAANWTGATESQPNTPAVPEPTAVTLLLTLGVLFGSLRRHRR